MPGDEEKKADIRKVPQRAEKPLEEEKPELEEEEVETPAPKHPVHRKKVSLRQLLLVIFATILMSAVVLFLFYPGFHIEKIEISGVSRVKAEEILQSIDVEKGDHLYSRVGGSWKAILDLRYGKLEEKLKSENPYIGDVKIEPSFPGYVYVNVTERKKVAYVTIPDGYAVIADDGVVLEIENGKIPEGIPQMRGLPIVSAQLGKKLELSSQDGYDICITILGAILSADVPLLQGEKDIDFLSYVKSIRYCGNMTTFLDLKIPELTQTITVKLDSLNTITDDMNWLKYAITSGYFDNKTGTVLDMTNSKYILRDA